MPAPEQEARLHIDAALQAAGWSVQDAKAANVRAGRGLAVAYGQAALPGLP